MAVVERQELGGTCVNVGCVPKKVMWNAAFCKEMIHQAEGYGYTVGETTLSMPALKKKRKGPRTSSKKAAGNEQPAAGTST